MVKIVIPLVVVSLCLVVIFGGCVPTAGPAPTVGPEPAEEIPTAQNGAPLWRSDLATDFGEPFAFKPDGTPFRVATSYIILGCEEMVNYEGVVRTNCARAGAEYSMFDANFDADAQVAYIEDLAAVNPPDVLLLHAVNELTLAPAVDKATEAGIRCYAFDPPCYSNNVISYVHHWFEGPVGSGICGENWVRLADQENKQYNIFEIWGDRAAKWSQGRHIGHYNAIKPYIDAGKITLTESPDQKGSEELTATYIIDAFTANPELNGIYMQGGGQNGIVAGLKAIDRYKPMGDPDHVVINTFELSATIAPEMKAGYIDYFSTHGPWDVCDVIVKVFLWDAVCGVDMPQDIVPPMFLISKDNINDPNSYMFGAFYWSEMPPAQWDKWPILDTETPGSLLLLPENLRDFYYGEATPWQLRAPTLADRKENAGY